MESLNHPDFANSWAGIWTELKYTYIGRNHKSDEFELLLSMWSHFCSYTNLLWEK